MDSHISQAQQTTTPKLFQPLKVGNVELQHRVVLAPLTRFRGTISTHVPNLPVMKEYYTQRASEPGTLLITEATFIAQKAGVYKGAPGIWSDEQIAAWKEITDAVHAQGSFIYCQLWALGRATDYEALWSEDSSLPFVGASDMPIPGGSAVTGEKEGAPKPRPLTVPEIKEYVELYAQAASNAVHKAGFDGVEIHSANGYLLDQFLQTNSNNRTDEYGGSIENRTRFGLDVVDAISKAVGPERTGIRISPWSSFQGMRMDRPLPTFEYYVSQMKARQPDMAYIHVVQPRIDGIADVEAKGGDETNDSLRSIWAPKPFISAGGYDRSTALTAADEKGDLVAMGRHFIANPDLVKRLKKDISLTPYNRATFYIPGDVSGRGYTDYPFADDAHL